MAKFYVQSGTLRAIIDSSDVETAALWAVHHSLRQVAPLYDCPDMTPEFKSERAVLEGVMVLGDDIRISERGFDRPDASSVDTIEAIIEWHQWMLAIEKLQKLIDPVQPS
jgi:hypothetical protein